MYLWKIQNLSQANISKSNLKVQGNLTSDINMVLFSIEFPIFQTISQKALMNKSFMFRRDLFLRINYLTDINYRRTKLKSKSLSHLEATDMVM